MSQAIIIDCRTPAEYETGHLQGSRLIDFNNGEFEAAIPFLDPEAEYLLYCRSGNRSGQAAELMRRAGIPSSENLGSLDEAVETTGIPVVFD